MSRRAERPRGLAVATPTALNPRSGASERSEVAPGADNEKRPEGRGSQREARVCRRPGAPSHRSRAERPRVYAVAEPAATPEDRQSERSEVCRDREKGKYLLPEGQAGSRAAVVRRVTKAGRRDSHQPRSGRVQAKRGRAWYGAPPTYKAGGPRRSRCIARVRRWPGG